MMASFANVDVKKFGREKSIAIITQIIRNAEFGLRFYNDPDKFRLTEMFIDSKKEQLAELRKSAV